MSRVIHNDHPFSEDEIAYLSRRGRKKEIADNQRLFPPGTEYIAPEEDSVVLELSHKVYDYVSSRSIKELKSELKEIGLPVVGSETDLKVRLAQYLQELEDNEHSDA